MLFVSLPAQHPAQLWACPGQKLPKLCLCLGSIFRLWLIHFLLFSFHSGKWRWTVMTSNEVIRAVWGIVLDLWRGHCSCCLRYQQIQMLPCPMAPWNPGLQGATGRWAGKERLSCLCYLHRPAGVELEGFVVRKWEYWSGLAESLTLKIKGSLQTNRDAARAVGLSQGETPEPGNGISSTNDAWDFTLLLSCKGYCPGGFVFSSFVAACKEEIACTRCFIVLWNAENTESMQGQGWHSKAVWFQIIH